MDNEIKDVINRTNHTAYPRDCLKNHPFYTSRSLYPILLRLSIKTEDRFYCLIYFLRNLDNHRISNPVQFDEWKENYGHIFIEISLHYLESVEMEFASRKTQFLSLLFVSLHFRLSLLYQFKPLCILSHNSFGCKSNIDFLSYFLVYLEGACLFPTTFCQFRYIIQLFSGLLHQSNLISLFLDQAY